MPCHALATRSRAFAAACTWQRQAHNIMRRRYCAAACALVTVTSSGTTFLTLARVPALGARQHAALLSPFPASLPFSFTYLYPCSSSVFPPHLFLSRSPSISLSPRCDLGWGTNNARVRAKSASRIAWIIPRAGSTAVVCRNYLTMINEAWRTLCYGLHKSHL